MRKTKKALNLGPRESHPYNEFLPQGIHSIIIGSFPIGKFTNPERRNEIDSETEIDFFYGGNKNKLWNLIGECYDLKLNSIQKIKDTLTAKGIGVGDVISSCRRNEGSALDKDLKEIEWNTALYEKVRGLRLLFTSKTVKNWFEKNIGPLNDFEYVVLISPSPAALIWLASTEEYKNWLKDNPGMKASDYRLVRYKKVFKLQK